MLRDARVYVNLGSSDLERTVGFYEGKLGLPLLERRELLPGHPEVLFAAGGSVICVEGGGRAPSPPKNTPFVFEVDDVPSAAAALREAGIDFEEYDLPGLKTENGIASVGPVQAAWFRDPDGYLLGLVGGGGS